MFTIPACRLCGENIADHVISESDGLPISIVPNERFDAHGSTSRAEQLLDCELGGLASDRRPSKRHTRDMTLTARNRFFLQPGTLHPYRSLAHCKNGSIVGDGPTPRFYPNPPSRSTSTVGCLWGGRRAASSKGSILGTVGTAAVTGPPPRDYTFKIHVVGGCRSPHGYLLASTRSVGGISAPSADSPITTLFLLA